MAILSVRFPAWANFFPTFFTENGMFSTCFVLHGCMKGLNNNIIAVTIILSGMQYHCTAVIKLATAIGKEHPNEQIILWLIFKKQNLPY